MRNRENHVVYETCKNEPVILMNKYETLWFYGIIHEKGYVELPCLTERERERERESHFS